MTSREELIQQLIQPWNNRVCISKYRQGNILWSVWHDLPFSDLNYRHIACDILKYDKENKQWVSIRKYEHYSLPLTCPVKYFDMVPLVVNEEWREKVKAQFDRKKSLWNEIKKKFKFLRKTKSTDDLVIIFQENNVIPEGVLESTFPIQVRHQGILYGHIKKNEILAFEIRKNKLLEGV